MSITKTSFGKLENGDEVYLYTLDNGKELKAEIITYGGIIKNLYVNGKDIVLGRDTLEQYLENDGGYGAAIGRHANRIGNAEFTLNDVTYKLTPNNGRNSLHGGVVGFAHKNWDAFEGGTADEPSLIMTLTSPDGDEGFPGKLDVKMTYTLTKDNSLVIHYEAISDADTIVNLTNHTYFNLNGHDSGTIDNHILQMNCDFYTPNTDECLPYGEIHKVAGTPFDFTTPKAIGKDFKSDFEQIKMFDGYDHNFIINGRGYRKAATISNEDYSITMETYTDKPGVQIYTGNSINTEKICKGGNKYNVHQGVCFETQFFPNSTTYSHYPSPILKKGEKYDYTTEYHFIIK